MTKTCEIILVDALSDTEQLVSFGHIMYVGTRETVILEEPKNFPGGYLTLRHATNKQLAVTTDLVN